MKVFLLSAVLLAIAVVGMAITIIVKPGGKFPDGEISHNKKLREQGIICAKEEELRMWGRGGRRRRPETLSGADPSGVHTTDNCPEGGCEGCEFYQKSSGTNN